MILATQSTLYLLFSFALFASGPVEQLAQSKALHAAKAEQKVVFSRQQVDLQCASNQQVSETIAIGDASKHSGVERFVRCTNSENPAGATDNADRSSLTERSTPPVTEHMNHPIQLQSVPEKTLTIRAIRQSETSNGAAIEVKKTVGTPTDRSCPSTDAITVTAGTTVIYCYKVINIGAVTLTHHTVTDEKIGPILSNYTYTLNPIPLPSSSVLFTIPKQIQESTTDIVTWTGIADDITAVSTDTTTVIVPSIEATMTVGIAQNECSPATSIYVSSREVVYHCITVKNIGESSLNVHTGRDELGNTRFADVSYQIEPQEQISTVALGIMISETVTQTHQSLYTWTAATDSAPISESIYATATATAAVQIPKPSVTFSKTVGTNADGCAATTEITVLANTPITYCYYVLNSGDVPLVFQTVEDSELGHLIDNTELLLQPLETGEFTIRTIITETNISSATWYASTGPKLLANGQAITISDTSSTTVNVIPPADVTAVVFNDSNQNQTRDNTEAGLLGAEAILTNAEGQAFTGTTDSNGTVTFSALEPGLYTLTISSKSLGDVNMPTTENMPARIAVAGGDKEIKYFGFLKSTFRTILPFISKE